MKRSGPASRLAMTAFSLLLIAGGTWLAFTRRSGFGCGPLVMERYSLPLLAAILLPMLLGSGALLAALRLTDAQSRWLWRRALLVGFGIGLSLMLIEVLVRLSVPMPRPTASNLRIAAHETIGQWRPSNKELVWGDHAFRTDENGIYARTATGNDPPAGARRVMMIGDSFLEGVGVAPAANMSVVLEAMLNTGQEQPYHVLNVGLSGFGPLRYLLVYRSFAPQYQPDTVIVTVFVENDFADDARLYHQGRIMTDADGHVTRLMPDVDLEQNTVWDARGGTQALQSEHSIGPLRLVQFMQRHAASPLCVWLNRQAQQTAALHVRPHLQDVDSVIYAPLSPEDQAHVERTLGYLSQLHREASLAGAEVFFVIIPEYNQIVPDRDGVVKSAQPQDILMAACEKNQYRCLDLLPTFAAYPVDQLYIPGDAHFTEQGHRAAAEAIYAFITE